MASVALEEPEPGNIIPPIVVALRTETRRQPISLAVPPAAILLPKDKAAHSGRSASEAAILARATEPAVQPERPLLEREIVPVLAIGPVVVQTGSVTETCPLAAAIAVLAEALERGHGRAAAEAGPAWAVGEAPAAVGVVALEAALAADAAAADGGNRHGSHKIREIETGL